jgi:hypothetical protein
MTSGMTGRQRSNGPDIKKRAAREKLASLRRALTDAEAVLTRAAQEMVRAGRPPVPRASPRKQPLPPDVQAATRAVSDYFGRVVDLMGEEGNRLSEQVMALTEAVQRLERRLDELPKLSVPSAPTPPPSAEAPAVETPPVEAPPPARPTKVSVVGLPVEQEGAPAEPQFAPGGEGIQLLISSVPGFQGLMEVQRALTHMPAVEGASVERYLDGEARIVLLLREPLTARRIVDGLTEYIGEALTIEEARPEALRLHLRFSGET